MRKQASVHENRENCNRGTQRKPITGGREETWKEGRGWERQRRVSALPYGQKLERLTSSHTEIQPDSGEQASLNSHTATIKPISEIIFGQLTFMPYSFLSYRCYACQTIIVLTVTDLSHEMFRNVHKRRVFDFRHT